MQIEIKRLQSELKLTSLFVTHDQHEAMSLSDRICLMSGGNIQQFATPEEVYFNPANGFVSGFVGSPNQLSGVATEGGVELAPGLRLASNRAQARPGGRVRVTLRQEDLALAPAGQAPGLAGRIALRIFEGASVQYIVALSGGPEVMARVSSRGPQADLPVGTEVVLSIPADRVFVAPEEGAA
ncbi:TOBE domain-containing protein [Seohaeicola zhoushanensis]